MDFQIRDFRLEDTTAINQVALRAFEEYRSTFSESFAFEERIGNMAALASIGEIIVASSGADILGAVAYIPAHAPKSNFFKQEWPVMRMLVVAPNYRGKGIGRALSEECINRARRDGSPEMALHTSSIMKVALPMYQRMGFEYQYEAPPLFGVPYGVYLRRLDA